MPRAQHEAADFDGGRMSQIALTLEKAADVSDRFGTPCYV